MGTDDDIAASLPEPPPPAPARRDAAIDAAMRRFDGEGPGESARTTAAPQRPAPWWTRLRGPQLGALVSVALVALVGVPALWLSMSDRGGSAENAVEYITENVSEEAPVEVGPQAVTPPPPQVAAAAPPRAAIAATPPPSPAPQAMARADIAPALSAAPAPAPAPAPPPPPAAIIAENGISRRAEQRDEIVTTARRAPPAFAAAAPAPKMAAADSEDHSIVVTGSRISRKPAGRGDWNACTVNDPARTLRNCKGLVNTGAKGDAGRAATHLSDGLARAWEGDLDGAISAFDQAIAASPRNAFAYLNRGLARQRSGDSDNAIADLDRAVRYAPRTARVYYNRSIVLKQRGDARRARIDEERAVDIDPTYDAVVQ